MAYAGGDRIKELSNSSGTGSFVLSGAVVGEVVRAFSAAEDGQYVRYLAKHVTAAEAEVGAGLYTHGTRTLTRLHRSYPSEGAGAVAFSAGGVHVANTPSVRDVVPFQSTSDPAVGDDVADGHLRGNRWVNTSSGAVFECVDPAPGAAVWSQINATAGAIASEAEARAGTDNTKTQTPLRTSQTIESREAVSSTSFNPASVQIDDDRVYDTYTQSGAVGFTKNAAGTFRRGKVVKLTFNSDGSALTWTADFEPLVLGATLPSMLPAGLHTLLFSWDSHRSKIQVAWASLLAEGAVLKDYSEVKAAQTGVTGAATLDYAAGQKQTVTLGAGNVTSVTISNWPPSGEFGTLTVDWIQDGGGGRTVADPANSSWFGGAPTYDTAGGKRNRVLYTTEDGGATLQNHYAGAL